MAGASIICRPQQRDELRNGTFGFIFQFYHLLPELNTLENVMVPMMISNSVWSWFGNRRPRQPAAGGGDSRQGRPEPSSEASPGELSGGEMQRAAIARAWSIGRACCSPTSRPATSTPTPAARSWLLRDLNRKEGLTIIMVTHNLDLVPRRTAW